jgi:hypothetical protein
MADIPLPICSEAGMSSESLFTPFHPQQHRLFSLFSELLASYTVKKVSDIPFLSWDVANLFL